jgi:hypothetical protein
VREDRAIRRRCGPVRFVEDDSLCGRESLPALQHPRERRRAAHVHLRVRRELATALHDGHAQPLGRHTPGGIVDDLLQVRGEDDGAALGDGGDDDAADGRVTLAGAGRHLHEHGGRTGAVAALRAEDRVALVGVEGSHYGPTFG